MTKANNQNFLSADSAAIRYFADDLFNIHGVGIIHSYIEKRDTDKLDLIVANSISAVKKVMSEMTTIDMASSFSFTVPLPFSDSAFMRVTCTGAHFELEFTPMKLYGEKDQSREIYFGSRGATLILQDSVYGLEIPQDDPYIKHIGKDSKMFCDNYERIVLELGLIGSLATELEAQVNKSNLRLNAIAGQRNNHAYIEYAPDGRPRDAAGQFHVDYNSATFSSLQTSEEPSSILRGVDRAHLHSAKILQGTLFILNNQLLIKKPSSGSNEFIYGPMPVGPIHDIKAPTSGRRCILNEMGLEPVLETVTDALKVDIASIPSIGKTVGKLNFTLD